MMQLVESLAIKKFKKKEGKQICRFKKNMIQSVLFYQVLEEKRWERQGKERGRVGRRKVERKRGEGKKGKEKNEKI